MTPRLPQLQVPLILVLLFTQTLTAQEGVRQPVQVRTPQRAGHSLLPASARPNATRFPVRTAGYERLASQSGEIMDAVTPLGGPVAVRSGTARYSQDPLPGDPSLNGLSQPRAIDAHRWEFNFQNAPWLAVLRAYAQEFGFTLHLSAPTDGLFSFYEERLLDATESLDILNDALLASGRILIRDQQRLTLVSATAEIPGNMIPFVSIHHLDSLGRNELATVAIPLRGPDSTQALEEIAQLQSALGQVRVLTSSGRVVVTDTGSYLRRMRDLLLGSGIAAGDQQAHVYQLRHARAEDVAKAITDFLSSSSGGTADAAGAMVSGGTPAGQRVVAEKTTNSLLVRGTSEELSTIERLVAELDRAPREVLVQALLVEVELGNVNELGVELGFQDSVLFDRSVVDKLVTINQTTTAPNGTQTTNQQIISQTAAPGFNFMSQPPGNNVAAQPGRIAPQGLSTFGMGRVNGDLGFGGLVLSAGSESVNILLRALDANFNIEVLSRPQVRSVENHEALIQIGQQVPIVDGVSLTPVGSANPNIRQDKAGIILKVTPRISPDGRVQLDVEAEKSAFNLTPGSGVPIFTDATNGNVIEAPIKDITTATTTVSVQSGNTIVLGGMITNDQSMATRKLPWLGDLPVIGRLFRYDYNKLKRKELLVFLTPMVLENDRHADQLRQLELDKIRLPAEAWNIYNPLASPSDSGDILPPPIPTDSDILPPPQSSVGSQESAVRLAGSTAVWSGQNRPLNASQASLQQAAPDPAQLDQTADTTDVAAPTPRSRWEQSANYRPPRNQMDGSFPPEPTSGVSAPLRFQRSLRKPAVTGKPATNAEQQRQIDQELARRVSLQRNR